MKDSNEIEMPKLIGVEIRKVGFTYRIFIHGVMFKRRFVTYSQAKEHVLEMHSYFGDCTFVMKEAA